MIMNDLIKIMKYHHFTEFDGVIRFEQWSWSVKVMVLQSDGGFYLFSNLRIGAHVLVI